MNGERRGTAEAGAFRAYADTNLREKQLGSTPQPYPQRLGEWLGTAVKITRTLRWQVHYALLAEQGDHERRIAGQSRGFIELHGAVLVGALAACDAS